MEGTPAERLGRAFLRALEDPRYGGITARDRPTLSASVSYPRNVRRVRLSELEWTFELGRHGLLAVMAQKPATLLLPFVAEDEQVDVTGLLSLLARKADASPREIAGATLCSFETETATSGELGADEGRLADPIDAAAAYLANRVDGSGCITFLVDARARKVHAEGPFHHGRAATVVAALAEHGGHPRATSRARRRLQKDLESALRGRRSATFPEDPAEIAGTVALAVLAGVPLEAELSSLSTHEAVRKNAWHAAQVVAAIGSRAPRGLFEACERDLVDRPWAPWTALAADRVQSRSVAARVRRTLSSSIRKTPPYTGAANVTSIPELALTAVAVEALAPFETKEARAAAERAASFLRKAQFVEAAIPASHDEALCHGGFPLSPIVPLLRSDVTAHALSALMAVERRR
jgi:hypothetical protein